MKKMKISGIGRHIASRLITNADLLQWMDTSDEWIQQRTGIKTRYWVDEDGQTCASDLGLEASKIALKRAGWQPEDIDLIIFATLSPDMHFPGPGCLLQHKLGLCNTPAMDIRQQCSAFLYGMATADAFIKSGHANRILFVGAEVHSKALRKSNEGRDVSVIFGDGAGALCLEGVDTDENVGLLSSALHANGEFAKSLTMPVPASRITEEDVREYRHAPYMDGRTIYKIAVKKLPEVANEVLNKANLSIEDIDMMIPHQANIRINQAVQAALKLPDEKTFNNIQRYGNLTAASIPVALDEAIEKEKVNRGDTLLFLGLGAGLTWGGVVYRYF
jgi:3-oxoacyl-[acyl-carrier-protein] synthase-3